MPPKRTRSTSPGAGSSSSSSASAVDEKAPARPAKAATTVPAHLLNPTGTPVPVSVPVPAPALAPVPPPAARAAETPRSAPSAPKPPAPTAPEAETKAAPVVVSNDPFSISRALPAKLPPPSGIQKRVYRRTPPVIEHVFAPDTGTMYAEYESMVYLHLDAAPWVAGEKTIDLAQLVADLRSTSQHEVGQITKALRLLPVYLGYRGFKCSQDPNDKSKLRVTYTVPLLSFENACI